MKKIILTIILGMFLISLASASIQTIGPFKINKDVELIQTCANCSFNNITSILSPNSSTLITNVEMTKDGSNYNYTLNSTFVSLTGRYIVNGIGDENGIDTIWNYDFEVNPTGTILKTSDSINYVILTLGSLFFFLLALWGAIVLPFKNNRNDEGRVETIQKLKYFKLLCFVAAYILFVWLLNLFLSLSTNFSILTQYTKFFEVIFSVVNSFSYPLFVMMFVIMLFLAWHDLALRKLLLRGLNPK